MEGSLTFLEKTFDVKYKSKEEEKATASNFDLSKAKGITIAENDLTFHISNTIKLLSCPS
jgi:hypothetical protein